MFFVPYRSKRPSRAIGEAAGPMQVSAPQQARNGGSSVDNLGPSLVSQRYGASPPIVPIGPAMSELQRVASLQHATYAGGDVDVSSYARYMDLDGDSTEYLYRAEEVEEVEEPEVAETDDASDGEYAEDISDTTAATAAPSTAPSPAPSLDTDMTDPSPAPDPISMSTPLAKWASPGDSTPMLEQDGDADPLVDSAAASTTDTADTKPPPSLLSLPAEIRLHVYAYLLVLPSPPHQALQVVRPSGERLHPAILRTCRAVCVEALAVLYGENTFDAHPSRLLGSFPRLRRWYWPVNNDEVADRERRRAAAADEDTAGPAPAPVLHHPGPHHGPSPPRPPVPGRPPIRRFRIRVRLDADAPFDAASAAASFSGCELLEVEAWQASFMAAGPDAAMRAFEGVRGVGKARVWGSTDGWEEYARWLEREMRRPPLIGDEGGEGADEEADGAEAESWRERVDRAERRRLRHVDMGLPEKDGKGPEIVRIGSLEVVKTW